MLVGYARVSMSGQSLEDQLDALREAGCEKIFAEKKSGTSTSGRDALVEALDFVRDSSDTLVVTRLDRLVRSAGDLHVFVARLSKRCRVQVSSAKRYGYFNLYRQAVAGCVGINRRVRN